MGGNACSKTYKPVNIQSIILKRVDNNTFLNDNDKTKDVSVPNFIFNKEKLVINMYPFVIGTAPDPNAGKKSGSKYIDDCPENTRMTLYSFRKVGGVTPFQISTPVVSEKLENGTSSVSHKVLTYKSGNFTFNKEIPYSLLKKLDTTPSMNGKLFHALRTKGGDYVLQVYGTKMFLGVTNNGTVVPIPPGGSALGKVVAIKPEEFSNNLKQYKMAFSDANVTYDNQNGPIAGQPVAVAPEVYPENPNNYVPPTPDEVPEEPEGVTTTKQPGNTEPLPMAFPKPSTNLSPEQQKKEPSTEQQEENEPVTMSNMSDEGKKKALGILIGSIVGGLLVLGVVIALVVILSRRNPSPTKTTGLEIYDVTARFGSFFGRKKSRR